MAQRLKCLPAMWETWVRSLGREDSLEKEMATHSSTLAWRIPWTEKPGGLQSIGSQRVRHNWATSLSLSRDINIWWMKIFDPTMDWISLGCNSEYPIDFNYFVSKYIYIYMYIYIYVYIYMYIYFIFIIVRKSFEIQMYFYLSSGNKYLNGPQWTQLKYEDFRGFRRLNLPMTLKWARELLVHNFSRELFMISKRH